MDFNRLDPIKEKMSELEHRSEGNKDKKQKIQNKG